RGWADEEFARGLVDGYTSQRTFDANDAFEFVTRGKRWPDWKAEPMHERLTRCEQLQQRDRSRGALSRMKAAGRGWFYKSTSPANLSKRDRQLAKLGKPPSPTKAQANGKTRPPATAYADGKGGGWAVAPGISQTKRRHRPLAPDMDDRTGAADNPCGLASIGFRLPKPAPSISERAWREKQRAWEKEERPKTEWPEIQGGPFAVKSKSVKDKDDLRATAAAALEAFLAERSRHPLRAMKFTWFPDGQTYEAVWQHGQL